jgi:hypothetical protein
VPFLVGQSAEVPLSTLGQIRDIQAGVISFLFCESILWPTFAALKCKQ